DEPRPPTALSRARALVEAIEAEDAPAAAGLLAAEIPAALRDRPAAWRYVRERLDGLLRDGLSPRLVTLTEQVALPDRGVLSAVKAPAPAIGRRGASPHPAGLAALPAALVPKATRH